jgi:hypothetical protein
VHPAALRALGRPVNAGHDDDLLFGSAVLAVFLVFVFALGYAINRVRNRRFARAWAPLAPIIGGRVVEDGGGAATSWLVGHFEGRRVAASIAPARHRYSGDDAGDGHRYNHFEVALGDEPGAADWTVEERVTALGLGRHEWQVFSKEPRLAQRLRSAGVVELAPEIGALRIEYTCGDRTLRLSQDLASHTVPTPEQFRRALDALQRVAALNARCNPGPSA